MLNNTLNETEQKLFSFFAFILNVLNFFYGGFIFMKVWNWIPAEIFSLPILTFAQALGLFVFLTFFRGMKNYITYLIDTNKIKGEKQFKESIFVTVRLTLVFALAFIIQAFF